MPSRPQEASQTSGPQLAPHRQTGRSHQTSPLKTTGQVYVGLPGSSGTWFHKVGQAPKLVVDLFLFLGRHVKCVLSLSLGPAASLCIVFIFHSGQHNRYMFYFCFILDPYIIFFNVFEVITLQLLFLVLLCLFVLFLYHPFFYSVSFKTVFQKAYWDLIYSGYT